MGLCIDMDLHPLAHDPWVTRCTGSALGLYVPKAKIGQELSLEVKGKSNNQGSGNPYFEDGGPMGICF